MVSSLSMIDFFRNHPGPLIIDGGLATLLETKYGCDLNHKLWSTKTLEESPDVVRDAHADFIIDGGCDLIIACTYQTSLDGFNGDVTKFENSLDAACKVGRAAIEKAEGKMGDRQPRRKFILAGSIGSYGASLCNGEEYSGDYKLSKITEDAAATLEEYHLSRIQYLKSRVDVFAAETIPVALEGKIMSDLFLKLQHPGYITFSCKSSTELGNGESVKDAVRNLTFSKYLIGVGINCTSIKYIESLVKQIKEVLDEIVFDEEDIRPRIFVYPNSGETYCGIKKTWISDPELDDDKSFADFATEWYKAGATAIGGCCRVSPKQIMELKTKLNSDCN